MAPGFNKWMLLLLPLLWVAGSAHSGIKSAAFKKNAAHPFYVSVTEINHNAEEKSLEITCKVFVDDMENALKKNFKTAVDLSSAAQQERSGNYVSQYVQRHLQLVVDGRPVTLKFIGFEKESESVYCYFEAAGQPAPKTLDINNSLLHDFTPDQINIMHVTVGGKRQSTRLNFPARNAHFVF